MFTAVAGRPTTRAVPIGERSADPAARGPGDGDRRRCTGRGREGTRTGGSSGRRGTCARCRRTPAVQGRPAFGSGSRRRLERRQVDGGHPRGDRLVWTGTAGRARDLGEEKPERAVVGHRPPSGQNQWWNGSVGGPQPRGRGPSSRRGPREAQASWTRATLWTRVVEPGSCEEGVLERPKSAGHRGGGSLAGSRRRRGRRCCRRTLPSAGRRWRRRYTTRPGRGCRRRFLLIAVTAMTSVVPRKLIHAAISVISSRHGTRATACREGGWGGVAARAPATATELPAPLSRRGSSSVGGPVRAGQPVRLVGTDVLGPLGAGEVAAGGQAQRRPPLVGVDSQEREAVEHPVAGQVAAVRVKCGAYVEAPTWNGSPIGPQDGGVEERDGRRCPCGTRPRGCRLGSRRRHGSRTSPVTARTARCRPLPCPSV